MGKGITQLVDELPSAGLTVSVLNALGFAAPGEWANTTGFDNMVRKVTAETDDDMLRNVGERAIWIFNDPAEGYQKACSLYQTVDAARRAQIAAATSTGGGSASKTASSGSVAPKPEKANAIELALKSAVEVIANCHINGTPVDGDGDLGVYPETYDGESLIRMVALVCLDGLLPLGAGFIDRSAILIGQVTPRELEENTTFKVIKNFIPGGNTSNKMKFLVESFEMLKGWMGDLIARRNMSPQLVVNNVQPYLDTSERRAEYLAAYLAAATNCFEHTGTQTVARRLIERAVAEI